MHRADLEKYLRKAALDADFGALCAADSDASFEGFDLDEDTRRVLRRGGPGVLALLSAVLDEARVVTSESPEAIPPEPTPAGTTLPEIELYLRVAPQQTEQGLNHMASLHTEPPPDEGAVTFKIRVSPSALALEDGTTALVYAAAIDPILSQEPASAPLAFTRHQVNSNQAQAAAERVLQAEPEARYDRLLDLISVLTS
jgi:hypothetical protein